MRKIKFLQLFVFSCLLSFININTLLANGVWDGGGDGISWNDPLNWGDDIEPLATDDVTIPAATTIEVRMAGEVAKSIDFDAATSVLTIVSGDLTLDEADSGDLIDMPNGGTINVNLGGTLNLLNGTNGIDADGATINVAGRLIFEDMDSEAFDINNAPLFLTIQASGLLQGIATSGSNFSNDFIDIASSADGSIIDNFGTIRVNMNDQGSDFIDVFGSTTIRNNVGALIDLDDIDDNVFEFHDAGSTFDNFGTIDILESGDECFELDENTILTNHSSGIIRTSEVEDEVFELDDDSKVTNNGLIEIKNISGAPESTDEAIDLFDPGTVFLNNGSILIVGIENEAIIEVDEGTFTNTGVINMGMDLSEASINDEAIDIGNEMDAHFINEKCGIINITSTNPIEIGTDGRLTNDGIITTVFTGNNPVDGTFTNNGLLASPGGNFMSTNPVVGAGTIAGAPIPAIVSLCFVEPIPTMGQWGLLIFCLLIMNMSVFLIHRLKQDTLSAK